ncbi:MAG TPA: acetyltransferase [Ignavibacteria bacterium]|nr:acetyltransferase [Ignavibacteria bacterium]
MSKVIIFGTKDFAQLANYYLENDSDHKVEAFCASPEYLNGMAEFENKPLISLDSIEKMYPPGEFRIFAPMSPKGMNKPRAEIYQEVKKKGYTFISYISSKATVLSNDIGENCFILEGNVIQPYVKIDNNVILWSGNHIGHHGFIGDHVFFASQVVMSGHCQIEPYCYLGVNSAIKDGVKLAEGTLVGMGSIVLEDTDAWGTYVGSPARKLLKPSNEANI